MHLILLSYVQPMAEVDRHLQAHREWLDAGYAAGAFVFSGPREPRTGGVILVRSDDPDEVARLVTFDPFHGAGVAAYEIVRFTATKYHPDFAGPLGEEG